MSKLGDKAVVCGAGIAGLLATRVLSEFYESVVVVERDTLSDDACPRRGVRQGRHYHVLWSRGVQEFSRLFPGLPDELVAAGATVCDDGDLSQVSIRVGGHEYNRSGKFADPTAVVIYLLSRPLLESQLRRRVRALANVDILDGHDVAEPVAADPQHVTGVRVVNRDAGVEQVLDADLVVDAMGRGARTPAFLDSIGYGRPVAERSTANASYCSQFLRVPAGVVDEKMTFVIPEPSLPIGGAFSAYEHDSWIFTVVRLDQQQPPENLADMMALGTEFISAALPAALQAGEPLGAVDVFRYPGGVWRRYDKMPRFPKGFLVFGDAICSTNPIYGQGMTVAALEANALHECLSQADSDVSGRFFDAAAGHIGPLWASNQFNDLYMHAGNGRPSLPNELLQFREQVLTAAESSPALTEKLFRTMNLVDPPTDYSPLLK